MHVEQPLRPRALVQVVDILRDEQQLARPLGIEPRERLVRRIGLDRSELLAPRIVESVDQRRIAAESLGRRDVLDTMAFPQAVRTAEGREAAFGRHAGAGQDTMFD